MSGHEMNNIRKRNESSASASSSRRKYTFKRAIVMGRRGGSTTPTNATAEDDVGSLSARKLAATLWEMNSSAQNDSAAEFKEEDVEHRCMQPRKTGLEELMNGLAASKELLNLLRNVWGQRSLSSPLLSALRSELDSALVQVERLTEWRKVERERIRGAMAEELRAEKRLRRRAEWLNKKLGSELVDAKASAEREKRAKEILEQVCDELARGIGEDKAQVEELKRQSEKVRQEVEEERHMLQLADVLREERVQMKLSEAKYQFEERSAAVEQLRCELESYLKEINDKKAEQGDDDDDSGGSDLHSIELNMDNDNKSYQWSYVPCGGDGTSIETSNIHMCLSRSSNGPGDHVGKAQGCEDQIKRYISLKGLADHILSASEIPFASPSKQWG